MGESGRDKLLENLAAILLDGASSDRERQNAKRALSRLGDEGTLAYLIGVALSGDSDRVALDVLDLLADRRQLGEMEPALVGFLYDASPAVRQKAIQVLGHKASPRMRRSLEEIIVAAQQDGSIFEEADVAAAQESLARMEQRAI